MRKYSLFVIFQCILVGTLLAGYPMGSPRAIVILAEFKDQAFSVENPQAAFTRMLNDSGYSENKGHGSARDYFRASSYGKFTPYFDVFGPVELPQNMSYYGGNSSGSDARRRQLAADACNAAHTAGLDFSQYDADNDGYVDQVFIYYAGVNEAEGGPSNTVWPHRWTLNPVLTLDGKRIYDYACTSELRGPSVETQDMAGIGTFCHEFSHVLGLPDLYNTAGKDLYTPWMWDIMDYGTYLNEGRTPPTYSAYERFYSGFLTPTQILLSEHGHFELNELNSSGEAYLFSTAPSNLYGPNTKPTDFYMIENRQQVGMDTALRGHGLIVWRISFDSLTWKRNTPNSGSATPSAKMVFTVRANGFYPSIRPDSIAYPYETDPFPGRANIQNCNMLTIESVRVGTLVNITENNGIISFDVNPRYTITASAGPNGKISPDGDSTVNYDETIRYNITPDDGYSIDQIFINGVPKNTTQKTYYYSNISADGTISVTFKQGTDIKPQAEKLFSITQSNGLIQINSDLNIEHVRIVNLFGQIKAEGKDLSYSIQNQGIYFVQVKTSNGQFYTEKIIIQ